MKILITHELFPPDVTGGGETLTYRIAKELKERGHEVKTLTSGNPKIKEFDGIKTIRIPVNRYLMNLSLPIISKHAKDVDLIHTSSGNMCFPSFLAAKMNNKPICCYVHHVFGSNWKYVRGPILGFIFQQMEKLFLTRNYDAVIFQNNLSRDMGLEMGINKEKIFTLHPGVDYNQFQLKGIKREIQVLFVGNLSMDKSMVKIKGLEYLIDAAKLLPQIRFIVVGEGSYLKKIKKDSPQNVYFVGGKRGKELAEIYNKSLIFCLPSLAEGFGISILEAMASGCAIVSTIDIGQEGIIVKPKSSEDIARAIKYFVDNIEKAKRVGLKNRMLAKRYTWKKFIDELTKIYDYITTKT